MCLICHLTTRNHQIAFRNFKADIGQKYLQNFNVQIKEARKSLIRLIYKSLSKHLIRNWRKMKEIEWVWTEWSAKAWFWKKIELISFTEFKIKDWIWNLHKRTNSAYTVKSLITVFATTTNSCSSTSQIRYSYWTPFIKGKWA